MRACAWLSHLCLLLPLVVAPTAARGAGPAANRLEFRRQVGLHVVGVQRLSRVWWRVQGGSVFPGATALQRELLLDFLSEASRAHDVSKWGTRWRVDERFRAEFDELEKALNVFHGRERRPLPVERGSDLLHDFLGVKIFSSDTDPTLAALGKRAIRLINAVDHAALEQLLFHELQYQGLKLEWKFAVLAGVSLADLTHRHLASQSGRYGEPSLTFLEFGARLVPTADYLAREQAAGRGIPGLPADYAWAYPIELAIAHARAMLDEPDVSRIIAETSMLRGPANSGHCGMVFFVELPAAMRQLKE